MTVREFAVRLAKDAGNFREWSLGDSPDAEHTLDEWFEEYLRWRGWVVE